MTDIVQENRENSAPFVFDPKREQAHSLYLVLISLFLVTVGLAWSTFWSSELPELGPLYLSEYKSRPDIEVPLFTAILIAKWRLTLFCVTALALMPTFIGAWVYFSRGRTDFWGLVLMLLCETFSVLFHVLLRLAVSYAVCFPYEKANPF